MEFKNPFQALHVAEERLAIEEAWLQFNDSPRQRAAVERRKAEIAAIKKQSGIPEPAASETNEQLLADLGL